MSFDRIGPYSLRRSDLAWASLAIGFVVGGRRAKTTAWVVMAVAAEIIAEGILSTGMTWIGLGIFLTLSILIAAPALRSPKVSRDIYFCREGLHV